MFFFIHASCDVSRMRCSMLCVVLLAPRHPCMVLICHMRCCTLVFRTCEHQQSAPPEAHRELARALDAIL